MPSVPLNAASAPSPCPSRAPSLLPPALALRRRLLGAGLAFLAGSAPQRASAFANRTADRQFKANPGRPGIKLGVRSDGTLNGCDGVKPNCFSTEKLDGDDEDVELYSSYLIPRWTYVGEGGVEGAMKDLRESIDAYVPGAENIDGGGFEVQPSSGDPNYLYVQFESLKHGYVDDVEFHAVEVPEGNAVAVQLRSASRVGFLDLGVNAKRINKIAKALPADRWDVGPAITAQTHGNYFSLNGPYLV